MPLRPYQQECLDNVRDKFRAGVTKRTQDTGDCAWYIYALLDPDSLDVRYVGWTYWPQYRLREHIHRSKRGRTHRDHWVQALQSHDKTPILRILDYATGNWAIAEKNWISILRAAGCRLTNSTDGGEGVPGLVHSAESRAKASRFFKSVVRTREWCEAISEAQRGKVISQTQREAQRRAMLGRRPTEETRRKMSAAGLGRKRSPEFVQKLIAFHKGRKRSPEACARMSAAKLSKHLHLTAEHKEKLRITSSGRKQSAETIAKKSAALRKTLDAKKAAICR